MADATLPKDELKARAVEGAPLSQEEVSAIESEETNRTGFGPVKGGPAATAQSIHDKQQTFFQKAGDLARKPVSEITKEDAAEVQKAEVRSACFSVVRDEKSATGANLLVYDRLGQWESHRELVAHHRLCSPSLVRTPNRRINDLGPGPTRL